MRKIQNIVQLFKPIAVKLLLLVMLFCMSDMLQGQQLPVFSSYSISDIYRNPSASLNSPFKDVQLLYNNTAPGFKNAPVSYFLGYMHPFRQSSYQGPSYSLTNQYTNEVKQAMSAYLMYDEYGEMKQLSAMIAYAQNFKINDDFGIAFGLSLGIFNYRIDYSNLTIKENQDQTYFRYINQRNSFLFFDANFGLTARYKNYKLEASMNQLTQDKALLSAQDLSADFNSTMFVALSSRYSLSKDITLVPELNFYRTGNLPYWLGSKAHFIYQDKYMAGAIFNLNRNVGLELGMIYDAFVIQYSFLINTNAYNVIGLSNHNLGIRYSLNPRKNTRFSDYY